MARKTAQIRYFQKDSVHNTPDTTAKSLVSGEIFKSLCPILKLGIQTLPGIKVYINDSNTPIYIGGTGIFELELNERTEINALSFGSDSLELVEKNPMASIIVDIVYDNYREGGIG